MRRLFICFTLLLNVGCATIGGSNNQQITKLDPSIGPKEHCKQIFAHRTIKNIYRNNARYWNIDSYRWRTADGWPVYEYSMWVTYFTGHSKRTGSIICKIVDKESHYELYYNRYKYSPYKTETSGLHKLTNYNFTID